MFLHLGADTVIPLKNVIAIIDYKDSSVNKHRKYVEEMRSESRIIDVSEGYPNSFVITEDMLYLSAISSVTLKKRAEVFLQSEENVLYK